jgi:hypothetical protein
VHELLLQFFFIGSGPNPERRTPEVQVRARLRLRWGLV